MSDRRDPVTRKDLLDEAVDCPEIARRSGYSLIYIKQNITKRAEFPAPLDREINSGRWWRWSDVSAALDVLLPGWQDRAQ